MLKCMSKFMKQSFDLSEGHEGWGISNWWRLVANHVCHRKTDIRSWSCKHFASSNHFIHPCSSTLFLGPGVWVVVKVRLERKGKKTREKRPVSVAAFLAVFPIQKKEIKWRTGRSGLMKRVILQNLNQEDNAVKMCFNH